MRKTLDKLSGVWCLIDGIGGVLVLGSILWMSFQNGIWVVGIGVVIFEILCVLNSFYMAHRGLVLS